MIKCYHRRVDQQSNAINQKNSMKNRFIIFPINSVAFFSGCDKISIQGFVFYLMLENFLTNKSFCKLVYKLILRHYII